jgi:galactokinase
MRRDRLDSALARFQELYPRVRDVVISRGAGRSTFLDHNDHGDGTAIGFPVRQDDLVIMGYNPDGDEIALNNMEPRVFSEGSIRASDVAGLRIQKVASKSQMKWTDYCAAILQETLRTLNTYGVERLPGLCVLVDGREEMGGVAVESNMSSSAALEMGITYGVEALVGIAGRLSGTEMTEIGRRAEAAIGFPCGKLDQTCSTGDRARVNPEDRVVVAIHCIPSLTPDGRDATHTTVSKMPTLPGINVNTGEKGPAQREYNIRVIEGEIASWILARKLEELSPGFARLTRAEVENAFPRVNPDHNGKPYLYDADRLYPVFLKPAFFSRPFLAKLGIDVSRQDLYAWVKRNLPQEADGLTEEELIGRYGVPREYFENVTRSARESGIDLNGRRYKLYGSLLHIIDDEDRGVEMAKVLEDAVTKTGRERETALDRFGQLEQDAYHSLAQSFGNSTERIDKFVAWAVTRPWCRAGRHFGAGWGGFLQNWVREGMEASAMTDSCEWRWIRHRPGLGFPRPSEDYCGDFRSTDEKRWKPSFGEGLCR